MSDQLVLKLGTRSSPLAMTQSGTVARALERAHPGLVVELVEISTTGDRVTGQPLASFGGAGVFVKELEAALLDKRVDFAVHSLKDMPTKQPEGLIIGAISEREDARDAAVVHGGVELVKLPRGSVIGCGSPRRRAQLKASFPNLEFAEIRGNVDTRIRKVDEGQYAGTILALAGLKRLGLDARATEIIPYDVVLPAPGQGALGIECRTDDVRVRQVLKAFHDENTAACVTAERSLLEALGGGCHLPLGALGSLVASHLPATKMLRLEARLGHPDGSALVRCGRTGSLKNPVELGQCVALNLLQSGGQELIDRLRNEGASGV